MINDYVDIVFSVVDCCWHIKYLTEICLRHDWRISSLLCSGALDVSVGGGRCEKNLGWLCLFRNVASRGSCC